MANFRIIGSLEEEGNFLDEFSEDFPATHTFLCHLINSGIVLIPGDKVICLEEKYEGACLTLVSRLFINYSVSYLFNIDIKFFELEKLILCGK